METIVGIATLLGVLLTLFAIVWSAARWASKIEIGFASLDNKLESLNKEMAQVRGDLKCMFLASRNETPPSAPRGLSRAVREGRQGGGQDLKT